MPRETRTNKSCRECNEVLKSEAKLIQHFLQKHPGLPPFKCPYPGCQGKANQKSNMDGHIKNVHERDRLPTFICPHPGCGKTTTEKRFLDSHMKTHLDRAARTKFKCPQCPQEFVNECNVAVHVRDLHPVEAQEFFCTTSGCGFKTNTARNLALHQETHSENRRVFACNHTGCSSTFYSKISLDVHQKNHERPSDKEFKCSLCPLSRPFQTNRRGALNLHFKAVHDDSRPHMCSFNGCTAAFKWPSHLRQHLSVNHVDVERLNGGNQTGLYCDVFDKDEEGNLQIPRGTEEVLLLMVKHDFSQMIRRHKIDCSFLFENSGIVRFRHHVIVDASIRFPEKKLLVLLEIDQHTNDTTPIKELRRMQDATDALHETQGEDEESILWVRFNPSGLFRTGSGSSSPPLAERVSMLRDFLREYEPPRDKDDVQVAYLFYDNDDGDFIRVVELPSA
jgi:hypothetical protein